MDREPQVRRNARLLTGAHAFSQVGFSVLLIVGVPAAQELTGHDWASGIVWSLSFAAGAIGAFVTGRWMDRVGRRPGLVAGYAAIAVAAVGAAASIRLGSFAGLVLSTAVFGVGTGAANLARGAVADMYPPDRRGRAVGVLLAAGTVGAIGGPLLIPLVRETANSWGADPDVMPWLISLAGAAIAVVLVWAVRPDPRDLAFAEQAIAGTERSHPRSRRELLAVPAFRTALIAVAVSQMAMVGVMGVTPNALKHLGHEPATPWVISGHVAGMYAFAPLVGVVLDLWGRRAGLFIGLGLSGAGALIAGMGTAPGVIGVGLFAIGLGWSATYVAVTTVISDVTRADERAGALGLADLLLLTSSAGAALVGGLVLEVASYATLGVAAAVLVGAGVIVVGASRAPLVTTRS